MPDTAPRIAPWELPTHADLDLIRQRARSTQAVDDPHADDPAYDSDFYEDN